MPASLSMPLRHELIRASAGTGKTYQLTNRYLQLLRMGEPPDEILATTFTRKAAGEILDRVLCRLAEAATSETHLAQLGQALEDPTLTREDCLTMLTVAARHLHRLRIGTLDSFFAQLAGSFSLELGLPPGWRIVEAHVDDALRAQAVEAVLDGDSTADLMSLVHALTKGETSRSLQRVVRDTIDQLYKVYCESDAQAWHRVPRGNRLTERQFHEAVETLRTLPLPADKNWQKAHAKELAAVETADWDGFIQGGIAGKIAAGEESYCRKPITPEFRAAYEPLLQHAKAIHLNLLADQTEATYRLLDKFHGHYQRLKTQFRALRFDDITRSLAQATDAVGVGDVAFRLDAHLHHLLLDEFQDTSLAQWSVIRPFAQQVTAKQGRSFFCVGDVKQAIYGWRGGVAEIFEAVSDELKGLELRPLDTSFRSSPVVIDTVNRIFTRLHEHENLGNLSAAVARWQQQFNTHTTARTSFKGYACLQAARRPNEERDIGLDDKQVTLKFAAEQVARLRHEAPGCSIGVLVRRNDAVRQLIFHLRELGIDASEEGGNSLDDSAAVRVLLSLMQLADHPGDYLAAYHLETSPLAPHLIALVTSSASDRDSVVDGDAGGACASDGEGSSAGDLVRDGEFQNPDGDLGTGDRRAPLDASAPHNGVRLARPATAGQLARKIRRQLMQDGYGPTIYAWSRLLAPACNDRELRRLEKLTGLAYSYHATATTRPRDFLAFVNSQRVKDPSAADVRVMTVHQSKGLQFDIVVLTELETDLIGQRDQLVAGREKRTDPIDHVCRRCGKDVQALLPEAWQRLFREADELDLAESLCVLYVAVTRAIHALHMIVGPGAENEKSLHKTFGGLLRAALTDGDRLEPETTAFEHGDPQWAENPGGVEGQVSEPPSQEVPLEVRLASSGGRRVRNLERVSPSSLEGGTRVTLGDTWSDDSVDRTVALQRGTLIHAWFEQIEWLDDGPPDDARLRQIANEVLEVALDAAQLDRLLAEFHALLADRRIADCLSRKAYARFKDAELRVENERPIAVREGDRLLVGNIDRLVTVFDNRTGRPIAADILDFKTDMIPVGKKQPLRDKTNHYRPQIEAYCRAVERITSLPIEQVAASLLFTVPRTVVPIARLVERP